MNKYDVAAVLFQRGWRPDRFNGSPEFPQNYWVHPTRQLVIYIGDNSSNSISILTERDSNICVSVSADYYEVTDNLIYVLLEGKRVMAIDIS